MRVDVEKVTVPPGTSLREVMAAIDRSGHGIALVAGADRRLAGTVTDGDVRRAMLDGLDLDAPVEEILGRQQRRESFPTPLTAPASASPDELLHMMSEYDVRHIPRVDAEGRLVDLAVLEEMVKDYEAPMRAVVMAGGYGLRLRPFTDDVPKPMLPVGDRPLLEHIVAQLREAGIRRVNVTTHYRGEEIARHFGDGADFGVDINYTDEEEPLGTAGALALLERSDEPLLVMNGDILTDVDFRAMLRYHREHDAEMTVAARSYEVEVPYGIVESEGVRVTAIAEKPSVRYFVNAGIYLLEPNLCRYVPRGERHDMPDLVNRLVAEGHRVVTFPVVEYWLDIGAPGDYEQAQRDARAGRP